MDQTTNTLPFENTDNNSEPESCPEESNKFKEFPSLLLKYTYYLDLLATKTVNIGYDNKTFLPVIVFHNVGKSFITLNAIDWMSVFVNIDAINKHFTLVSAPNQRNQIKFYGSRNIRIKTNRNPYYRSITLQHKEKPHQKISLTFNEWTMLLQLMDFFNSLIFYYKSTMENVKGYYEDYLRKCYEGAKYQLSRHELFEPRKLNENPFNHSRLFHEIPLMCRDKLYDDVYHYNTNNNN